MGGNDEREQTLNQLLAEMDGFDGRRGVVLLAATNRPESLDPALLRPGRFDRRVPVELPDLAGRKAVLKVHSKDVHIADAINWDVIARSTAGASGAELANIINEAALRAVREGRDCVCQEDLEESVETVIAGAQRKTLSSPRRRRKLSPITRSAMRWWPHVRQIQRRLPRSQSFHAPLERWDTRCRWMRANIC